MKKVAVANQKACLPAAGCFFIYQAYHGQFSATLLHSYRPNNSSLKYAEKGIKYNEKGSNRDFGCIHFIYLFTCIRGKYANKS